MISPGINAPFEPPTVEIQIYFPARFKSMAQLFLELVIKLFGRKKLISSRKKETHCFGEIAQVRGIFTILGVGALLFCDLPTVLRVLPTEIHFKVFYCLGVVVCLGCRQIG